jgi:hypothetical protein
MMEFCEFQKAFRKSFQFAFFSRGVLEFGKTPSSHKILVNFLKMDL